MTEDSNEYVQQRISNMHALAEMGWKAFGRAFERTSSLGEIREKFEAEKTVRAAGRLIRLRLMGKSVFADIQDGTGRFQIYIQKSTVGDDAFKAFKLVDVGDHIGVEGTLFATRTDEKTIQVRQWVLLAKALRPLPEKWHGLKDVEARYRRRYLDLISNPAVRELFDKRIEVIRVIREFLRARGFQEVETPMMQSQAGGAAAKPFSTHYNALNQDMYLRIAPELYLKRLLVGGFDKIFELNRNFRNEGISRTHNPEFTMLEIYEAYSDVEGMKRLVQDLIQHVAETVFGGLVVGAGENAVDLGRDWREVTYRELISEEMGEDWYGLSPDEARRRATNAGLEIEPDWDLTMISHEVYEKLVEGKLKNPTFVRRFPSALIPLARACEDDETLADVFELVIGGQEIAPAYTELNDPGAQRARFSEQGGDIDEEFLAALEHGMPPAGGMGIGIDRLVMILTGAESIRDVILFPQLRPKE